jgi:hypothetical protein
MRQRPFPTSIIHQITAFRGIAPESLEEMLGSANFIQ